MTTNYSADANAARAAVLTLSDVSLRTYRGILVNLYAEPGFTDVEVKTVAHQEGLKVAVVKGCVAHLHKLGLTATDYADVNGESMEFLYAHFWMNGASRDHSDSAEALRDELLKRIEAELARRAAAGMTVTSDPDSIEMAMEQLAARGERSDAPLDAPVAGERDNTPAALDVGVLGEATTPRRKRTRKTAPAAPAADEVSVVEVVLPESIVNALDLGGREGVAVGEMINRVNACSFRVQFTVAAGTKAIEDARAIGTGALKVPSQKLVMRVGDALAGLRAEA